MLGLEHLWQPRIAFERYEVLLPTEASGAADDGEDEDGGGGLPPQVCEVDVCPGREALPASAPCVLILPGLRGHSLDLPGTSQARAILRQGWRVVVLHRRGHGIGRHLTAPRFDVFGDPADVEALLAFLRGPDGPVAPDAPLFLIGNSTGSALCMNTLRHFGSRSPFVCALGICPGYDVSCAPTSCLARVRPLYQAFLLRAAKAFFCERNAEVLEGHDPMGFAACLEARNFQEFVAAHAGFAGFPSVAEYVAARNPVRDPDKLSQGELTTPVVFLNSADDPICVKANVLDHAPSLAASEAPIAVVLTTTGTHCPFLDGPRLASWSDAAMVELFAAALAHKEAACEWFEAADDGGGDADAAPSPASSAG